MCLKHQPFLSPPFAAKTKFQITEGWIYSKQENKIHGFEIHRGLDFACRRGTPVLAPADGFAFSSFSLSYAGKKDGTIVWLRSEARLYKGKFVGFGLGNFIQIYHPRQRLYTSFGHLENVAESLPYFEPTAEGDGWKPKIIFYPEIIKSGKKVKRGEIIGYVGDSGISWGYKERPGFRPDPKKYPSWDETHTHFEIFSRDESGKKEFRYDPFGIYGGLDEYKKLPSKNGWLWLLEDKDGRPRFAKINVLR